MSKSSVIKFNRFSQKICGFVVAFDFIGNNVTELFQELFYMQYTQFISVDLYTFNATPVHLLKDFQKFTLFLLWRVRPNKM